MIGFALGMKLEMVWFTGVRKIISIRDGEIVMRIGRPYLVSSGTILHVDNENLVQRGEILLH